MPFLHDLTESEHSNSNRCVKYKPKEGFVSLLTNKKWLYENYWSNDKRQGFGIIAKKITSGTYTPKYRGDYVQDKRQGKGNSYYANDGYYVGEWKNGKRSGYGRMWYGDCSFYDGDWECDKKHGLGLFVKTNGNRYEGAWKQGKKHGLGKFYHFTTGQMQEGAWFEDTAIVTTMEDIPFRQSVILPTAYPIGQVEIKHPDKVIYTEQIKYIHVDAIRSSFVQRPSGESDTDSDDVSLYDYRLKYIYV